jgi:hypothetical protein
MRLLPLLFLAATPFAASAETISQEIARTGLAATETRLAALTERKPEDQLALGSVQFLRAIEGSFQTRWKAGLTDRTGMLPLLRLPLTDNPNPPPFDPATIAQIFRDAEAQLTIAQASLAATPSSDDFGLTVSLGDLWFDVNDNATRDTGENLLDIAGPALLGWQWAERDPATPAPVIRFDAADAAWLSAYAHLLTGISQIVLAYDPTEPISRVMGARATMAKWGEAPPDFFLGSRAAPDSVDTFAMILATLNQAPDPALMLTARDHLLACIAENRRFWTLVGMETDNAQEWLPNDSQTSALGLTLPPGTGVTWQGVLADGEAILKGEKLVPYWRIGDKGGVNVGRIFTDPRAVDVAGWFQGWAALPYLETGPLVTPDSWSAFENLVGGDPMLLSIWLN